MRGVRATLRWRVGGVERRPWRVGVCGTSCRGRSRRTPTVCGPARPTGRAGVRGERSFVHPVLEGLACFALPLVAEALESRFASVRDDGDVQLGQGGSVREKDRVRLLSLPTTRDGLPAHQAVSSPCRPVMVRSGTMLAVRTAAPRESEVVQAAGAVAQRALGDLGEQSRGADPGAPRDARTTRRAIAGRSRPVRWPRRRVRGNDESGRHDPGRWSDIYSWAEDLGTRGRTEHDTTSREGEAPGYGGRESRARTTRRESRPGSGMRHVAGCRSQTTERQEPERAGGMVFDGCPHSLSTGTPQNGQRISEPRS